MAQRVVRRRRKSGKAPVFILLALILLLIAAIASIFSLFVMNDLNQGNQTIKLTASTPTELFPGQKLPGEITANALVSRDSLSSEGSKPSVRTEYREVEAGVVPETSAVDDSYFKDAVFIGDSISLGMKISRVIPYNHVIAAKNVGINQVVNGDPVYNNQSLMQAIEATVGEPKKIYILLGSNGLPGFDNDTQISYYKQLIDQLKSAYPAATVYVESLTPMTSNSQYQKRFTMAKVNDFNQKLQKVAVDKQVYYLNVQEALKDKNGNLLSDYAATDGLHMVQKGHKAVVQYYRTHAVYSDGKANVVIEKGE